MNAIRPLVLTAAALFAVPAVAQTANELLQTGNTAWNHTQCVQAARNYYALQVRYPEAVKGAISDNLSTRIRWCERNTSVYSGFKGDDPGAVAPPPPQKPATNVPNTLPSTALDRCAIYAQLAIAQYQANVLDRCNYAGNRWNDEYRRHYDWCATVGNDQLDQENLVRQQDLIACHQR